MEKEAFDSFKETLQSLSERQKADFCTLLMPIQARCAAGIAWTYQSNEWNFPHHESKPFLSISELSRIYSIERNPIQWSVLFRKVSTACDSNVNFTSSCHESQLDGRNIWVKKHVGIRNLTNLHKNAFSTVLFSKTFIVLTKSCVASVLEIRANNIFTLASFNCFKLAKSSFITVSARTIALSVISLEIRPIKFRMFQLLCFDMKMINKYYQSVGGKSE